MRVRLTTLVKKSDSATDISEKQALVNEENLPMHNYLCRTERLSVKSET